MPITPFHFGPGAIIKELIPKTFSFTLFCYSQVVTDLESGYHLLRHRYPIHTFFHTLVGATIVGLFCAITGKPLMSWLIRCYRERTPEKLKRLWGNENSVMSWKTALVTAYIGTYSHVLMDAIMHPDLKPFWPFSDANPMLDLIDIGFLHLGCLALGILGTILWVIRSLRYNPTQV
jgi:membrane-bound metal-dependent hydrolase YbcI (DUF457 family)